LIFARSQKNQKTEEIIMAKIKACYIKEGQEYIEVNLSEIHIEGTKVLEYPGRRFFYFSGYLIEVTAEEQKELFREKNRQKYIKRKTIDVEMVSLDIMISDEVQGYELIIDPTDYENQCLDRVMAEKAMTAVENLPPDERELILSIYIKGIPENTYSKEKGMLQQTVNARKLKILAKLRKNLENKK
jgi:DNA-directed RNA polymerase specialized sigma24 family protein